jgi:uncharacterized DUF497 family protein
MHASADCRSRQLSVCSNAPASNGKDRRRDYGETRYGTLGEIEGRVLFASFTRRGEKIRITSFRKANARESRRYRERIAGARGAHRLDEG